MKKLFTCLMCITICFFLKPALIYAHFPATDGHMTVTLHVDPNDDPIAEEPSHLYFLFTDSTNKFKLANCSCTISITKQGGKTDTQKLSQLKSSKPSVWGSSMPYTFPEKNVYHIVLTGKPIKANAFQFFTVGWYFRVDTTDPGLIKQGPSDIEVLMGALGVIVVGLILFGLFIKRELS